MDAVEYIRAYKEMHEKLCDDCPLASNNNGTGSGCETFVMNNPENAVRIVEDWWAKNKPKTNAEWVKEKLEEIEYRVDIEYLKRRCMPKKSDLYNGEGNNCATNDSCNGCKKWWDELHEEN